MCHTRYVIWSIVLYDDVTILKSFCELSKNFFLQYAQIKLAVDFNAFIMEDLLRFAPIWWNSSLN